MSDEHPTVWQLIDALCVALRRGDLGKSIRLSVDRDRVVHRIVRSRGGKDVRDFYEQAVDLAWARRDWRQAYQDPSPGVEPVQRTVRVPEPPGEPEKGEVE